MNTTIISIKIDKQTKTEAQRVADELGFSLSAVIKAHLKRFIREKRVDVSLPEIPNAYLLKSLAQSEKEIKEGKTMSFATGKDALSYLDREIAKEQHAQTKH